MRFHDAPSRARRIVKTNDVILSTVRTYLRAVASIPDHDNDIIVSTGFLVLRAIKDEIVPQFLKYAVLSDALISMVEASSVGISYPAINASDVVNFTIPVPPLPEQSRIATFLDRRCADIDRVIAATQRTIEEYRKLKQSIITEAVTHGVRGERKMKDSGVEWIGEIPEEWECRPIKNCFAVYSGATPKSEVAEYWDGSIIWVTPADFKTQDRTVSSGKRNLTEAGYASCGTTIVPAGSIVFSKRAPIGTVAVANSELCTNQGCLSCVPNKNADTWFFYYAMSAFTEQFNLYGTGTTFKEISYNDFINFLMPLPEIAEQHLIVTYLDHRCAEIDRLIEAKQQLLTQLEAYRKSVIYEYVTGKREVPQ